MVLLDTCALVELCKREALQTFKSKVKRDLVAEGAIILSISFAELACKVKANKLDLDLSIDKLYQQFLTTSGIEIINIGVLEWFDSIKMDWPQNQDPVDRLITAYAIRYKLPIITSDRKIKTYYRQVLW